MDKFSADRIDYTLRYFWPSLLVGLLLFWFAMEMIGMSKQPHKKDCLGDDFIYYIL